MTQKALPEIDARRRLPSLVEAADRLFRNTRVLGSVATAVTLGAILFVAASPSAYRAESLLLLRNDRPGDPAGGHGPITENDVRTEVELIQSRDMLERAARAAGLIAPESKDSLELERILDHIRQCLAVTAVPKADMVRLAYVGPNRWEGAHFLHELIRIHQDRFVALRTGKKLKVFEEESDRLSAELETKQAELSEFQRGNEVHSLSSQKELLLQKVADLEQRQHDLDLKKTEAAQRTVQIESMIAKLPSRMTTEIRTRRTAGEGAQVIEEASNVNTNRQTLESDLQRAQVEAGAASARLAKIGWQIAQARKELDRLESFTAEYERHSRDLRDLKERYEMNAKKAEEVRIQTALDDRRVTNVVVAQEAQIPARAESRPYLVAGIIWLAGILIALAAVMAFSRARKTFYTPAVLEEFAGIPVLGTVPLERRMIG